MALKVVVRPAVAEALVRAYRQSRPPQTLTEIATRAVEAWAVREDAARKVSGVADLSVKDELSQAPLSPARRGAPLRGEAHIIGGVPFSFRVRPELEERVRALAAQLDMRLSWVVDEALSQDFGLPTARQLKQAEADSDDFDEPDTLSQRVPRLHHLTPSPDDLPARIIAPKPRSKT